MLALFGNNTELTIYAQYTEVGNFVVIYSAVGADEETILLITPNIILRKHR